MTIHTPTDRVSHTKNAVQSKRLAWRGFQETAYRAIQGCKRSQGRRIGNDRIRYNGTPCHLPTHMGALKKASSTSPALVSSQAGEAEHQLDSNPTAIALAAIKFTDSGLALDCLHILDADQMKLHNLRWKFADIFKEHDDDYDFDDEYWQEDLPSLDHGMLKAGEIKKAERKERDFLEGIPRGWKGWSKLDVVVPDEHDADRMDTLP